MAVNLFDANFYRAANSDLRNFSDAQALSHFQNYGLNEGRTFSQFVDLNFYRASNSDLASLGFSNRQLFDHLQNYGIKEGRSFSPLVDLNYYRTYNSDLKTFNNEQLFEHLRNWGVQEGRRFSTFVDLNYYRASNNDLATHFNNRQLFEHLVNYGVAEGRRFSVSFDSNYYRIVNSDLASLSNSQLLDHFERYGLSEGRASSPYFNVRSYLDYNSDLKALGFNQQQAQQHFELYGCREGRFGASVLAPVLFNIPKKPAIDPGNTLTSAFNIGMLIDSYSVQDIVGNYDSNDYYRFTIARDSNFNLSLGGLSADADVKLIQDKNNNGVVDDDETIVGSYAGGTNPDSISRALATGTYYIQVYPQGAATNYTLNLSAIAIPTTTPRDPGNSLSTALDLGILNNSQTISEFVGSFDTDDYYRFTIARDSNFNLSLGGLSADADVELIQDKNNNGVVDDDETIVGSYAGGTNPDSISCALATGTYYIQVYPQGAATNYTLNLSAIAIPTTTPRDPGNSLSTALDLGILNGSRSFSDFVGSIDQDDYYRFTLTSPRNFNLSLSGLSDSTDVELIQDKNGNGQVDYNETLSSEYGYSNSDASIGRFIMAGTYFVRVHAYSYYNTNSVYTLSLFA